MKFEWETHNDGSATHSANDGTLTYFAVAPHLTLDDVATAFMSGYDCGDITDDLDFYVQKLATGNGANYLGRPNKEAQRK